MWPSPIQHRPLPVSLLERFSEIAFRAFMMVHYIRTYMQCNVHTAIAELRRRGNYT